MIYFVRHGESEANILEIYYNRGNKYGLTKKGISQVQKLAKKLRNVKFDKIYSSPLRRTIETADILSKEFKIPYTRSSLIVEYYTGVFEGKSKVENGGIRNKEHLNNEKLWFLDELFNKRIKGGESYNDIKKRFLKFYNEKLLKLDLENKNILIISHAGFLKCALPLVFENINLSFVYKNDIHPTDCIVGKINKNKKLICIDWAGKKIIPS